MSLKHLSIITTSFLGFAFYVQPVLADSVDFDNPVARKVVQDILNNMTIDQKIGQMTLPPPELLFLDTYGRPDFGSIEQYYLGGILIAGNTEASLGDFAHWKTGSDVGAVGLSDWQRMTNEVWYGIPDKGVKPHSVKITDKATGKTVLYTIGALLGTDAVHGDQHVDGAVIFPHNIGLGATHDPELMNQLGAWLAHDVQTSGFNWAYAPTVAVLHDYQWGRSYESFGSQPGWIEDYAENYVNGTQQRQENTDSATGDKFIHLAGVLTSTKHFIGDGNTDNGTDEGNVTVPSSAAQQFIDENISGYIGAKKAIAGNVMVSYNQLNKIHMSINGNMMDKYLWPSYRWRNQEAPPFTGFTVSDYGAIAKVATGYTNMPPKATDGDRYGIAITEAVGSGLDMIMLTDYVHHYYIEPSHELKGFYDTVPQFQIYINNGIADGSILLDSVPFRAEHSINEAVTHILEVKYAMGLIQPGDATIARPTPIVPPGDDEKTVVTRAAEESFVLLKNTMPAFAAPSGETSDNKNNTSVVIPEHDVIPVNPNKIQHVILIGNASDSARYLCGGWTIKWQGVPIDGKGPSYLSNTTTLLKGIQSITQNAKIEQLSDLSQLPSDYTYVNTVIIATLTEEPYAEWYGDIPARTDAVQSSIGGNSNKQPDTLVFSGKGNENTIHQLNSIQNKNIPIVTVLVIGRPLLLRGTVAHPDEPGALGEKYDLLNTSDALLVAWLPGSEGGTAIAKAIFGQYALGQKKPTKDSIGEIGRTNTLSVAWPKDISKKDVVTQKDIPQYQSGKLYSFCNNPELPQSDTSDNYDIPRFNCGFGLKTEMLPQNQK